MSASHAHRRHCRSATASPSSTILLIGRGRPVALGERIMLIFFLSFLFLFLFFFLSPCRSAGTRAGESTSASPMRSISETLAPISASFSISIRPIRSPPSLTRGVYRARRDAGPARWHIGCGATLDDDDRACASACAGRPGSMATAPSSCFTCCAARSPGLRLQAGL